MTAFNGYTSEDRMAALKAYAEIRRHTIESGDEDAIRRLEAREREAYDEDFWKLDFPTPSEQFRSHLEDLDIR